MLLHPDTEHNNSDADLSIFSALIASLMMLPIQIKTAQPFMDCIVLGCLQASMP
jgi:hypothetical protein